MSRKVIWLLLLALLVAPGSPTSAQAKADPDVTKGIALVDEGDFDGAILTLDNAARRLSTDKSKARDLSQAYLYLAIAYMGKGHEAAARAKFREAFGQIKDLSLSPDKFPPKVIDAFEAAKEEARKDATASASATGPGSTGATTGGAGAPEKKKGGSKGLLIAGGVAVVGGGVAVAAGGGGGGSTPTAVTTPPDPRKTETFTGTFCLRPGCEDYGRDYDIVVSAAGRLEASITWTNTQVFFAIELMDENYQTIARSNRITNTNSQVAADVSPRTSSPSAAYKIFVNVNNATAAESYTLTVKHP